MGVAFSPRVPADAAPAPAAGRVRVAALVDYYLPGYKAGGAIRTLGNMAAQLAGELDLSVITRDRDFGDAEPYPRIVAGGWTPVEGALVRYLGPGERTHRYVAEALRTARPDVLYLNSLYSPQFSLQPLLLHRMGRVPRVPVVVAPRGELAPGALTFKRAKKLAFLRMARMTGLYRGVLWQASSELEADEVRRWFGAGVRVLVAPDLRERPAAAHPPAPKRPGELRVMFLGRIAPNKNVTGALEMLAGVRGDVRFSIYGPVDSQETWEACRARIASLPANVRVEYGGVLPREAVPGALASHHLFLFPTLGENFGHAVLEALLAGLPVLTSDRTSWSGLEPAGAGWTLPLEQPERFGAVLQAYADLDGDEHAHRSAAARAYGESAARDESVLEANRALFRAAVQGR